MHASWPTLRRNRLPLSAMLLMSLAASACTLPNNVAIKDADKLRAAQTTCLMNNARQMDDRQSEPGKIGREIATACSDATERLVSHAISKASREERRAFAEEAELRATGYVKLARSGSL